MLAEKIVTMIDRGDATTRARDFADVYLLARRREIDAGVLAEVIRATARHRSVELRALRVVLVQLGTGRQRDWARFVERAGLVDEVLESYVELIDAVALFADPILTSDVTSGRWDPQRWTWSA